MSEKEFMLMSILDCQRIDLYTKLLNLTAEEIFLLKDMQQRRNQGEPLQYILGHWDFMGLKFFVDQRVFIPRPETEVLVELALKNIKELNPRQEVKILDLGTGSGNIAISLAHYIKDCHVTTVDISPDALAVAKHNVQYHEL